MSKVVNITPDTGPEKNGDEMVVTLRVADVRAIIREEVKAALAAHNPPVAKILYPLKEAADMLSVPPTWLAARARAGEIPSVHLGHYVCFNPDDLSDFAARCAKTS